MTGFDSSVFAQELEAELKSREENKQWKKWVSKKYEALKCVFRRKQ